jgi:hypothetical protein
MKTISIALCAASGLAVASMTLAPPAPAMPSSGGSGVDTVILNQVGNAPLRPCTVIDPIRGPHGDGRGLPKQVLLPWAFDADATC